MMPAMRAIRDGWEKTWPEVRCSVSGGLPEFVLAGDPKEIVDGVPVFYYHTVDREQFRADLAFLAKNGYATIGADDLVEVIEGGRPLRPRSVVITIDDGVINLYDVAFPLLREFGFRAVAFIAPWYHDALDGERHNNRYPRVCTWQEIERMHDSGLIDFQSHTYEHRYLPRWPEPLPLTGAGATSLPPADAPRSAADDFLLAKSTIERRLGKRVQHLAFPRYFGTAEHIETARQIGYRAFWWGMLPGRPLNRAGDPLTHIVRVDGEYLRRLPGVGRIPLSSLLAARCSRQVQSIARRFTRSAAAT